MRRLRERSKNLRHITAWLGSLLALPVAGIGVVKGASPVQIALWLSIIATLQLIKLLPEALELKEVYNEEV